MFTLFSFPKLSYDDDDLFFLNASLGSNTDGKFISVAVVFTKKPKKKLLHSSFSYFMIWSDPIKIPEPFWQDIDERKKSESLHKKPQTH